MTEIFRFAAPDDARAVLGIYAPFIESTAVTLEETVPSVRDFAARIERILSRHPYLVYAVDGAVLGYAYADIHGERAGYRYNVVVSVYLAPGARGRGIGRRLYARLFAILAAQGFLNAYAVITLPNDRSVGLHEAMGFRRIGVFPKAGHKLGEWVDVVWLGRDLGPKPANPGAVATVAELPPALLADIMRREL